MSRRPSLLTPRTDAMESPVARSLDGLGSVARSIRERIAPVASFVRCIPDPREVWASRNSSFETLHVICPSNAVIGEPVEVVAQAWDDRERLVADYRGRFHATATDDDADMGDVVFDGDDGLATAEAVFRTPGIHYVVLQGEGGPHVGNPVRVTAEGPEERLYWGDIHLHSNFSDGSGTMREGLRFGRDVMQLDVAAYTDHDVMGFMIPSRLQVRRMESSYFDRMKRATESFHSPGEYVTLMGYEWTQLPHEGGHLCVYFESTDDAELYHSADPQSDTYGKLWERLREWERRTGQRTLTLPHHSAEAMYPFDFSAVDFDDDLAPLVEVHSRWGCSERPAADGNPFPVRMANGEATGETFVRDALARDHRVGLMASSDYHGPRPGHSLIHVKPHVPPLSRILDAGLGWADVWRLWDEPSYPGGLLAIYAQELTREAVFDSLRSRRVYGTTQPDRIRVEFAINGVPFGTRESTVTLDRSDGRRDLQVRVAGTAPLERVTVVKNGDPWKVTELPGADEVPDGYWTTVEHVDTAPITGPESTGGRGSAADVYYVRVRQVNDGMAWAGPIWIEA